jgi:tetratricopeptide (TPR) repeat protein
MKILVIAAVVLSLGMTANAQAQKSQEKSFAGLQKHVEEMLDYYPAFTFPDEGLRAYEHFMEEYVSEHPDSAEGWYYLGVSIRGFSRNSAEKAFQKAIELKPDFAEAYIGLALYYCSTITIVTYAVAPEEADRVSKKAISLLEKALSLQPQFPYSYVEIGNAYSHLKQYEKALTAYEKAITLYQKTLSLNPKLIDCYESIGKCYERLGLYDQATATFERAYTEFISTLSEENENEKITKRKMQSKMIVLSVRRGEQFLEQKKYQEALSMFKRAVEFGYDNSRIHLQLGLIYLSLGDKQSAIAEHAILLRGNNIDLKKADELLEQINKH